MSAANGKDKLGVPELGPKLEGSKAFRTFGVRLDMHDTHTPATGFLLSAGQAAHVHGRLKAVRQPKQAKTTAVVSKSPDLLRNKSAATFA